MPELPEVETIVRNLHQPLSGRTIKSMTYHWRSTIHTPEPEEFAVRVVGQRFKRIYRRAKYILCELDTDTLIIHLKLTGRLYIADNEAIYDADRWIRFCLELDENKQLRFSDSRKFGRVYLVEDVNIIIGKLGPEPLEDYFTVDAFIQRFNGYKRNIKSLLLDQKFIAGVGNIYADEALHRAGIHPLRNSYKLSQQEIKKLYYTIRETLTDGIQHEGASINWYRKPDGTKGTSQNHFYVYGRDGKPCRACGRTIEKMRVAQRGTHFCSTCQPR